MVSEHEKAQECLINIETASTPKPLESLDLLIHSLLIRSNAVSSVIHRFGISS